MNLLGAILYDPGTAVSKSLTSLLAMTAFDTTNLRLAITVPSHGMVLVRMRVAVVIPTATSLRSLLGVMDGATVRGRVRPFGAVNSYGEFPTASAEFVLTSLTPGAMTLDAAYGVETTEAGSAFNYGGPNNTTANDAWGAFCFEIWDPRPLPTAAPGAVGGLLTAPTTANVGLSDLSRILGAAVSGTAAQLAAAFTKFFDKASPTGTINSLPDAVPDAAGGLPVTGTRLTALGDTRIANLDATVSSRSTYAGGAVASVTAAVTLNNVQGIKKNTALANWPFMMYDSLGLPKTGLQASLRTAGNSQRRLDAGAFADLANIATITEIANGWYTLDWAASDLNGNTVALRLSATGAADTNLTITTVQA